MKNNFTFIDLFAGAGGFAEGFYQENYTALSHIEFDRYACDTLKHRMEYYNYSKEDIENSVLHKDITDDDVIEQMNKSIKDTKVDIIIGGPPCQSFSSQGKARDPNGMQCDPRNYLYESYMRILNHYKPNFFVFENVSGILSTKINGKLIIKDIFKDMKKNYKILEQKENILLNAVNFGIPQERKRVIIIGVRKDLEIDIKDIYSDLKKISQREKIVTVEEAISDLPKISVGKGEEEILYKPKNISNYVKLLRNPKDTKLYHHRARNHNDLDQERYKNMSKNRWTLNELLDKKPSLAHPKKRVFNNSYVVQHFDKPSKTIIAHLYKDGNQFIHPDYTQQRTFTAREAARIQSFPDDFIFPCSRTQQYKQIGNAVPPLLARHIASVLKKYLIEIG
jgi:DNA (cytosine-5)-methyltransferase 1